MNDDQDQPIAKETEEEHEVVQDGQLSSQVVARLRTAWGELIIVVTVIVIIVCCRIHLHLKRRQEICQETDTTIKHCIHIVVHQEDLNRSGQLYICKQGAQTTTLKPLNINDINDINQGSS